MFKKFALGFMAAIMVTTPAMAGRFGGSSSFSSSRSFSSGSSYRPTASYSRPSYSAPSSSVTTPRFTSGSTYNTSRPAQTRVVSRSTASYGGNTYVNHNYVGYHPYGYMGGGGTFSSPWFWMWMMDRNQQPAYVNGGAPMVATQPGYAAPIESGGILGYILMIVLQLIVLVLLISALVWIVRKLIFRK